MAVEPVSFLNDSIRDKTLISIQALSYTHLTLQTNAYVYI